MASNKRKKIAHSLQALKQLVAQGATGEIVTVAPAPIKGEVTSRTTGFRDAWGAAISQGDTVWHPRLQRSGVVTLLNHKWWVCWEPGQQTPLYDEFSIQLEVTKGA